MDPPLGQMTVPMYGCLIEGPEMTKTFDIYFDFEKLLIFFNSFDFDIGFDVQK